MAEKGHEMTKLRAWAENKYNQEMDKLSMMDNRHPGQPAPPGRDFVADRAAALAEVIELLELPGE